MTFRAVCEIKGITGEKGYLREKRTVNWQGKKFENGNYEGNALARYANGTFAHQNPASLQQYSSQTSPKWFWIVRSGPRPRYNQEVGGIADIRLRINISLLNESRLATMCKNIAPSYSMRWNAKLVRRNAARRITGFVACLSSETWDTPILNTLALSAEMVNYEWMNFGRRNVVMNDGKEVRKIFGNFRSKGSEDTFRWCRSQINKSCEQLSKNDNYGTIPSIACVY